jgi:nucleoside permease NupC
MSFVVTTSDRSVNSTVNFLEGDNMYRIITMAATTAATIVMTDYLALAVVLATMLAMSVDNVTGALLMIALIAYLAPAITSEAHCRT